jgi:hypothetical protein
LVVEKAPVDAELDSAGLTVGARGFSFRPFNSVKR